MASKTANKNKKDALLLLRLAEDLYSKFEDETFDELCYCVHMFIIQENIGKKELYYQSVFMEHCQEILGDEYSIFDKQDLKPKRPDAWVLLGGSEIPVEMKLHDFNGKALAQLLNYMSMYGCSNGIAIGERLTVDIPENIVFIGIDKVKKCDEY